MIKSSNMFLYTTAGCHLCELALALLSQAAPAQLLEDAGIDLQLVDVANDTELFERYGVRIPVIQVASKGQELGWPFNEDELLLFLRAQLNAAN